MTDLISFPGLGFEVEVNRVAFSLGSNVQFLYRFAFLYSILLRGVLIRH